MSKAENINNLLNLLSLIGIRYTKAIRGTKNSEVTEFDYRVAREKYGLV
jgi:hypothetical protein